MERNQSHFLYDYGLIVARLRALVPAKQTQCCFNPDLQSTEKLDPAGELNKRISWNSTDWSDW